MRFNSLKVATTALILVTAIPSAAFAQAAAPQPVPEAGSQSAVGDWWGEIEATPGQMLRYAVHIVVGPDGKLGGTIDSLDSNLIGAPLADVTVSGNRLEFRLETYPGRFEGIWDAAAKAWQGKWWAAGQSFPVALVAGKPPGAAPGAPKPPVVPDLTLLSAYAKPGRLVDIGGRRIDLRCEGTGGPTVILITGLGGIAMNWYAVHPAVAKRVRTCSFDKASYGFSDPAPLPQSLPEAVDDLHAALTAAQIAGPYILVGHSMGGVEARLFAQRWPDEVAGMVLVDSSFANQRNVQASLPGFEAVNKNNTAFRAIALACIERMARAGFGPATPNYNQCVPPAPPGVPADLVAAWPKFFRPSMWAANISLGDWATTPSMESIDHLDFGAKPLVVLTAGKVNSDPKMAEYTQAFRKIWIERHEGFARMSSRGVHIIVPDSGHMITGERPDAVIDAVDQVLAKVAK